MTQNYICVICRKKFSRKWNASRHNNTVHFGISNIFNRETEITLDNNKLNSDYEVDKVDKEDKEELFILDLFGKMLQNFEELENTLSHKSENEKNRFLSDLLVAALATPNPVKSLYNAISFQRSLRAKFKFVNCISKSTNVLPSWHRLH